MRYHRSLSAERVRSLPWKTQIGMIASELSRASHLQESGGGPEVLGCLERARELLGVLESSPTLPTETGAALVQIASDLSGPRLREAPEKAAGLYQRLMSLYST